MTTFTCIKCNADDTVTLKLNDCESFHCTDCGDDFTVADVNERIAQLAKLVKIADAAKKIAG